MFGCRNSAARPVSLSFRRSINTFSHNKPIRVFTQPMRRNLSSSIFNHTSPFWNTKRKMLGLTEVSLSNVCGHASFMLLGLSYVTTDILSLRCLAMGGISLSVLFQFYRPLPLYLPIRWNFLFLAINSVMVGSLLNERNEAEKMASWQRTLYETEFAKVNESPSVRNCVFNVTGRE